MIVRRLALAIAFAAAPMAAFAQSPFFAPFAPSKPVQLGPLPGAPTTPQLSGVVVNITRQRMTVIDDAGQTMVWPVATGREGLETPPGRYKIIWMDKDHFSTQYDAAPMPFAMFFKGGYAIHGTFEKGLGRPASHGCVRLSLDHAKQLFGILREGDEIEIIGTQPGVGVAVAGESRRRDPRLEDEPDLVKPGSHVIRRAPISN